VICDIHVEFWADVRGNDEKSEVLVVLVLLPAEVDHPLTSKLGNLLLDYALKIHSKFIFNFFNNDCLPHFDGHLHHLLKLKVKLLQDH